MCPASSRSTQSGSSASSTFSSLLHSIRSLVMSLASAFLFFLRPAMWSVCAWETKFTLALLSLESSATLKSPRTSAIRSPRR